MNPLFTYLAPAIDNATYSDLFLWTLLLIPTLFRCIRVASQVREYNRTTLANTADVPRGLAPNQEDSCEEQHRWDDVRDEVEHERVDATYGRIPDSVHRRKAEARGCKRSHMSMTD